MLKEIPYTGIHPVVSGKAPFTGHFAKHRNGLYAACLAAASDPESELFHRDSRTGVLYRRGGASHRCAFWAGYDHGVTGNPNPLRRGHPSSDAAVCYRAGRDFAKHEVRGFKDLDVLVQQGRLTASEAQMVSVCRETAMARGAMKR